MKEQELESLFNYDDVCREIVSIHSIKYAEEDYKRMSYGELTFRAFAGDAEAAYVRYCKIYSWADGKMDCSSDISTARLVMLSSKFQKEHKDEIAELYRIENR